MTYYLLIIGLILVVLALWNLIDSILFLLKAKYTEGKIVDWKMHATRSKYYPYPIVEYVTPSGERHTCLGASRSSTLDPENKPATGGRLKVAYDPENPGQARVFSFRRIALPPLGLGILGGGALVAFFNTNI